MTLNAFKLQYYTDLDCSSYRWMLDSKDVDLNEENSHYSLVGGNLVISNPIKNKHTGIYSCLATNMYGTLISREASVQFGCKWPRCEPPFSLL